MPSNFKYILWVGGSGVSAVDNDAAEAAPDTIIKIPITTRSFVLNFRMKVTLNREID